MKRSPFLVVVPMILGGAFLLLLVALMSRVVMRPSPWREQVDYYLNSRPGLAFVSAARAARPSQFRPEMSSSTFTRSAAGSVSVRAVPVRTPVLSLPTPVGANQPPPLPYPPEDVWCVTLSQPGGGQTMIFVALHVYDMWSSEWLVHDPAGDATATAAAIGCR